MFFDLVQHRLVQRRTACAASKHSTANGGMTGRLHVSIICVYLRSTLLWPWYLQTLESTNVVAKGTRRRTHDAPYCRYTGEARWLSLLSRDNLHSYCEGHAKEAPICALHMRSTFKQKHTFGMTRSLTQRWKGEGIWSYQETVSWKNPGNLWEGRKIRHASDI